MASNIEHEELPIRLILQMERFQENKCLPYNEYIQLKGSSEFLLSDPEKSDQRQSEDGYWFDETFRKIKSDDSILTETTEAYIKLKTEYETAELGTAEFSSGSIKLINQIDWYTGRLLYMDGTWSPKGYSSLQQKLMKGLQLAVQYRNEMKHFMSEARHTLLPTENQLRALFEKLSSFSVEHSKANGEGTRFRVKVGGRFQFYDIESSHRSNDLPVEYRSMFTDEYVNLNTDFKDYFINVLRYIGEETFTLGMMEDKYIMELLYSIFTRKGEGDEEDNSLAYLIAMKIFEHTYNRVIDESIPERTVEGDMLSGFVRTFTAACIYSADQLEDGWKVGGTAVVSKMTPLKLLTECAMDASEVRLRLYDISLHEVCKVYEKLDSLMRKMRMSFVTCLSVATIHEVFQVCGFPKLVMVGEGNSTSEEEEEGLEDEELEEDDSHEKENSLSDSLEEDSDLNDDDERVEEELLANGKRQKEAHPNANSENGKRSKKMDQQDTQSSSSFFFRGMKFVIPPTLIEALGQLPKSTESEKMFIIDQMKKEAIDEFKEAMKDKGDKGDFINVDDCIEYLSLVPV